MALLELYSQKCSVDNTVRWPIPSGKSLQIKIYKGQEDPGYPEVMILDQNGDFQYGSIRRDHLTDMKLKDKDLHNVLAICTKNRQKEVSITQSGDSGALVMSLPRTENNVIYIYGIASGIYTEPTNDGSLTVANSLWDVIHELRTNRNCHSQLQNNNSYPGGDIDFI